MPLLKPVQGDQMSFHNFQDTYQSKTAPFDYLIDSIMKPLEINQIIKDDRGKQWQVKGISYFYCYSDIDHYIPATKFTPEHLKSVRVKHQNATVIEYYHPKSFAFQIYRKQLRNVQIRVS